MRPVNMLRWFMAMAANALARSLTSGHARRALLPAGLSRCLQGLRAVRKPDKKGDRKNTVA